MADGSKVVDELRRLAQEKGGHFMDQFTYAERATDWRSNNNIAESIFVQMAEPYPLPQWIVCGAGTGGTSATLGRYVRYQRHDTRICVADPDNSVFHDYYVNGDRSLAIGNGSRIEGIGRPRVEPSFIVELVDAMVKVPDACSLAALHYLERIMGRRVGGSTGTIFCAMLSLAQEMRMRGEKGAIVGILCDGGERYLHSYYNRDWLCAHDYAIDPIITGIQRFASERSSEWNLPVMRRQN